MPRYRVLRVTGDHHSMGIQHGRQVRALRPQIELAIRERFSQIETDGIDARFGRYLRETKELLAEKDPTFLAMIRGQAEGLSLDYEKLLDYDLMSYLRDVLVTCTPATEDGCSTWAASHSATADANPILVKNRDYRYEHLDLQVVVNATPAHGYRYTYSSSAGSPGVFCAGINQVGLAVADTHVASTDVGPGLPDSALMMHLLEQTDSVSAANDLLKSAKKMGRNNLILADRTGHLAVFEMGYTHDGIYHTHDGVLVSTNHFVTPSMRDFFIDINPPCTRGNSIRRYQKTTNALEDAYGKIDVGLAKQLMASHEGGLGALCRHPMEGGDSMTISTCILLPVQQKMLFCHGLPCQGVYDEFNA